MKLPLAFFKQSNYLKKYSAVGSRKELILTLLMNLPLLEWI